MIVAPFPVLTGSGLEVKAPSVPWTDRSDMQAAFSWWHPQKNLRQDASWAGITVTDEVTALAPELYLGHEVNSVFLLGLGQQC